MSDDRRALLHVSPGRAVWRVAWPVVLTGWLHTLYLVADAFWVGRLGPTEPTALSAVSFGWWILVQTGNLAAVGVQTTVAQATGAGRHGTVPGWGWHGVVVSLAVGAVAVGTRGIWVPAYLDAMGLRDPAVREGAEVLLRALAVAGAAVGLQQSVEAVFKGLGHTRTVLMVTGGALILNAVLDPVFVWGLGPVPAFGLPGVAWATAIAASTDVVVALVVLGWRAARPRPVPVRAADLRRIVRIGLPVTLRGVAFSLVYVVLGTFITNHGDLQLAAVGVGHRLEGFTYLAAVGFGAASATMVGQHLGAGDVAGARAAVRWAVQACSVAMMVGSVGAWLGAEALYGLFTDDPAIVAAGAVYLRTQAPIWLFMGLESTFEGAFAGAGDTRPPLVIGATLTVARIPLAWALDVGLGLGVWGIWVAIAASTTAKG